MNKNPFDTCFATPDDVWNFASSDSHMKQWMKEVGNYLRQRPSVVDLSIPPQQSVDIDGLLLIVCENGLRNRPEETLEDIKSNGGRRMWLSCVRSPFGNITSHVQNPLVIWKTDLTEMLRLSAEPRGYFYRHRDDLEVKKPNDMRNLEDGKLVTQVYHGYNRYVMYLPVEEFLLRLRFFSVKSARK